MSQTHREPTSVAAVRGATRLPVTEAWRPQALDHFVGRCKVLHGKNTFHLIWEETQLKNAMKIHVVKYVFRLKRKASWK